MTAQLSTFGDSDPRIPAHPSQQDAWAWVLDLPFTSEDTILSSSAANDPSLPSLGSAGDDEILADEFVGWGIPYQQQQLPFPRQDIVTSVSSASLGTNTMHFSGGISLLETVSPQSSQSPLSSANSPLDEDMLRSLHSMPLPLSADALAMVSDPNFSWLSEGFFLNAAETISPLPASPLTAGSDGMVDLFALSAFPPLDQFPAAQVLPANFHISSPGQTSTPATSPLQTPSPSGSSKLTCGTCHNTYRDSHSLKKHEHIHTRPFICKHCNKRHGAKKDLHRHMWTKHPKEAERAGIPTAVRTCFVCGYSSRQDNVTRHMRTRHPEFDGCLQQREER